MRFLKRCGAVIKTSASLGRRPLSTQQRRGLFFNTAWLGRTLTPTRLAGSGAGIGVGLVFLSDRANSEGAEKDKFVGTAFYPPIRPIQEGNLKVSDLHTIAYSIYGNPNGKPVLFVHGGPGGGTDPYMARYFDPKIYRIILVDQRGCGKSTPFAEIRENTTYDSVRDFEKLRVELGVDKWQIFGGSWGSTLALAYSIENPERVTELVLRGIFLLRDKVSRFCRFLFPPPPPPDLTPRLNLFVCACVPGPRPAPLLLFLPSNTLSHRTANYTWRA